MKTHVLDGQCLTAARAVLAKACDGVGESLESPVYGALRAGLNDCGRRKGRLSSSGRQTQIQCFGPWGRRRGRCVRRRPRALRRRDRRRAASAPS